MTIFLSDSLTQLNAVSWALCLSFQSVSSALYLAAASVAEVELFEAYQVYVYLHIPVKQPAIQVQLEEQIFIYKIEENLFKINNSYLCVR